MASSIIPIAALLLSLCSAAAAYTSIAEAPFSSSPAPAYTSIAEAPFSSSPAPAPESYNVAPMDVQGMDSRYLTVQLTAAANKVELFLATEVERRLKDPATADSERECLAICKELYESAAESMKKGVESVGAGDFVKANFDVSAFNTDVDTCSDCSAAGFDKFDQWAKGVAGDCLDRIVKHTNRI